MSNAATISHPKPQQPLRLSGFTPGNRVLPVRGGKEYFERLERMISEARESIHLQTYIFDEDSTGRHIARLLMEACRRGVTVYLLTDGYASQNLSHHFIRELKKSGIRFRFFEPLFRSRYFYFGRRLHHKLAVVDSRAALVGGINISNRYNDLPGAPAWFDYALYAEGPIAAELCILCWKSWNGFPLVLSRPPCRPPAFTDTGGEPFTALVRMRRNDWVRRKNQISRTYLELLKQAREQVIIVSSYFLPGRVLQKNLAMAVRRGVKVKVVMAGLSDIALAKNAERYMYDWLLRNGMEIYEFRDTILHAKIAVADEEWYTVGSYNVNNISAYASIELNLDVHSAAAARLVKQQLEAVITDHCTPITWEQHRKSRNLFKQFIRWASYQFIRGVFYLFTFYFKQHN